MNEEREKPWNKRRFPEKKNINHRKDLTEDFSRETNLQFDIGCLYVFV